MNEPTPRTTSHDIAATFAARERDWRCGAVVYQVLVDRFAPAADLAAKRHLYPAPKTLHRWDETPRHGRYLDAHQVWSQEIAFWGGDLASTMARLDHVASLGADVLYLNPVCAAFTNHKYDALDYLQVAPEYGSRADLTALADELHRRGMKLVLDGVFNHMGRRSPAFVQAEAAHRAASGGVYRDWFVFDPALPGGARCWWRHRNLPELNLEHPAVRAHLWDAPDSVVRSYLRDGADGWRLDVAFDIGPVFLQQLTDAAHAEKPGSLVVGEIPNYPRDWFPSVDGVMHFGLRQMTLKLANGLLAAPVYGRMVARMVADCDYEHLLKSWIYLDNHDTPRLATTVPDPRARRLAQLLQFTLPGSPNLYYGSELGMEGGDDPEMRAPMRWDRVRDDNPDLAWTRRLVALRRGRRALRIGNHRAIDGERLLAFERFTERAADSVLVLVNPSPEPVTETLLIPDSKLMDGSAMTDLLPAVDGTLPPPLRLTAPLLTVTLPAQSARVLQPDTRPDGGYTHYKRVA